MGIITIRKENLATDSFVSKSIPVAIVLERESPEDDVACAIPM